MMVEELCRKLKPILGGKIDRLYMAWLAENMDGKREIEQTLQIIYARTFPQHLVNGGDSALVPPPEELALGEYPIGTVTYAGRDLYRFGLREKDWIKHVLIVGASGSGKTNLCFEILKNFLQKGKPFLVMDWKRNYRDIALQEYGKNVRIFTAGRDVAPFRFNPLIPPPGTPAKVWLKKLIEIIAHATFVGEGVMYLLQKGLDETYRQFGLYDDEPVKHYPTLRDILEVIEGMEAKGREAGWMSSTLRALGALTFGETGRIFNMRRQSALARLLKENVILELDALTNADKTFLVESLLLWIHHYRLATPGGARERFEHAIIMEEAHHVIGKEKSDLVGGEAITDVIIREIRELGESVIIIDQCPSLLSLPARANTWCTVVLNLKDAKDVNTAARAMLLEGDDKKILGRLEVGEAVVKLQGRWQRPFSITIPLVPIAKGSVTDRMVSEMMGPYSTYTATEEEDFTFVPDIPGTGTPRKKITGITPEERKLMEDIRDHPYAGVVERYKRLGWSRRRGNTMKKSLIEKGLATTEEIPTRSGRVVMLKLTKQGTVFISKKEEKGESENRHGGTAHEYWKNRYAEYYRNKGYKVIIEEPIGGGKTVDLVARKGKERIAIEIETGRSDTAANVGKCLEASFNKVIVIATTETAEKKARKSLKSAFLLGKSQVEIICARKENI